MAALERLDPIINNLLRNDSPVLAVWQQARRVEKRYGGKSVASETEKSVTSDQPTATST